MNDISESHETRHCQDHGPYTATLTTYATPGVKAFTRETGCPACREADRARQDLERQVKEEQARSRKVTAIKVASCVPARYASVGFEDFVCASPAQTAVKGIVAAYADSWPKQLASGQSLLLVGGPGTGKTHLAAAVINVLAERLQQGRYGSAAELVGDIKRHYGRRGGEESVSASIADLIDVPLLVIDELDVGLSEHDLALLFRVIDGRYSELQPMILISNRTADQLEEHLGHRTMDRLRECAVTLAFPWSSYRRRNGALLAT